MEGWSFATICKCFIGSPKLVPELNLVKQEKTIMVTWPPNKDRCFLLLFISSSQTRLFSTQSFNNVEQREDLKFCYCIYPTKSKYLSIGILLLMFIFHHKEIFHLRWQNFSWALSGTKQNLPSKGKCTGMTSQESWTPALSLSVT